MQRIKLAVLGLLIISLVSVPVVANAHWHGGGGAFWGFGAGLITGIIFAPRPVYVTPPVYVAPPPNYYPYNSPTPLPPGPPVSGYSRDANAAPPPPSPGVDSKCREWRLIDRHMVERWDSYYGKWRQVPVEKWSWVEAPCNH